MTTPPAAPTPRTDHYRAEFKRRKETSDLIEWMLDEFGQEERRLAAAREELAALREKRGGVVSSELTDVGHAMLAAPDKHLRWYAEKLAAKLGCTGPYRQGNSAAPREEGEKK